jgi:hypothetical protein
LFTAGLQNREGLHPSAAAEARDQLFELSARMRLTACDTLSTAAIARE